MDSRPGWTKSQGELDWRVPDDRYETRVELGRGGMGVVHLVKDHWLGREVALKRPLDQPEEQLLREASITARLNHIGIPPLLDAGYDEQGSFYTMPKLEGRTLDAVESNTTLQMVRAVSAAASAVGHAHRRGFVHRDLKPSNLMLGHNGEVWVLDWGLAWDAEAPDNRIVGTHGFSAPEQADGLCTPASDVYALGKTLSTLSADADRSLEAVITRATATAPAERYPNGTALAEELVRWLEGRRVAAYEYSRIEAFWVWVRANRRWFAIATLFGLFALAVMAVGRSARVRSNRAIEAAHVDSVLRRVHAYHRQGDPVAAERLLLEAITYADGPRIRGEMLHSSGYGRPKHVESTPLPCSNAFPLEDGWHCPVEDYAISQQESLSIPDFHPDVRALRKFDAGWLGAAPIQVFGPDTSASIRISGPAQVAEGPNPAASVADVLIRFSEGLEAVEFHQGCTEKAEYMWADADRMMVTCREGRVISIAKGTRTEWSIEHPSMPLWHGETVITTFDGRLEFPESGDAISIGDEIVDGVIRVRDHQLAVMFESGRGRVFDIPTRRWVMPIPTGSRMYAEHEEGFRTISAATTSVFDVPAAASPGEWDLSSHGGVSSLFLDGRTLLAGSADGSVQAWHLDTGFTHTRVESGLNTTTSIQRAGTTLVASNGAVLDVDTLSSIAPPMSTFFMMNERLLGRTFSGRIEVIASAERARLPHRVLDVAAESDGAWLLFEDSTVARFDHFDLPPSHTLDAGGARGIAGTFDQRGVYLASMEVLTRRSRDGAVEWSWRAESPITAVVDGPDNLAVGDLQGRVMLLDPHTGALRAIWHPHQRRVSDFVFDGSHLYSTSWDGHVRRADLERLSMNRVDFERDVLATWGPLLD